MTITHTADITALAARLPRRLDRPTSSGRNAVRLNRRGRFVLRGLPLMLAVAALTAFALSALNIGFSPAAVSAAGSGAELEKVVVSPGDTLWEVAAEADPDADRYTTMERIAQLNELEGAELQPGTELFVPAGR